jgi:hypothetical protein
MPVVHGIGVRGLHRRPARTFVLIVMVELLLSRDADFHCRDETQPWRWIAQITRGPQVRPARTFVWIFMVELLLSRDADFHGCDETQPWR